MSAEWSVSSVWELYEEMNEIVCVTDLNSYELIYMNRCAREAYGIVNVESLKGKNCYEVLEGGSAPCAVCDCEKLGQGRFFEEVRYNPVLKKKLALKKTLLEDGGRKYLLELAMDLGAWEEQNREYEANEAMVNEGLRRALAAHMPEQSIAVLLEYLGQSLNGERVYIFEETGRRTVNNTYEWCADGVSHQKENLQDVPFEVVSMWYRRFESGENVVIKNKEEVKESDAAVYEYLTRQDIRSLVASPLVDEGSLIGFFGVDNPPVKFLGHISTLLHILGHFLVAMLRRRNLMCRLEKLCFEDQLTGIGNRHYMHSYLAELKEYESIGILYCDVIGLKRMNDSKGHRAGDMLLTRAGDCLKKIFEEYKLFRVGGDEFLALCEDIEQQELQRRLQMLRQEMQDNAVPMAIGCVWSTDGAENMDRLIARADNMMYEEKRMLYTTKYRDMARS